MENSENINNLDIEIPIKKPRKKYTRKRPVGRPKSRKKPKSKRPVGRPRVRPIVLEKRPVGRPRKEKVEKPKKIKVKIEKPKLPPKKVGRPRTNMTYQEAKIFVRSEGITSKQDYLRWRRHNFSRKMPLRPDKAYKNDNFSWNDFLGTNNKYSWPKAKQFMSFEDAKKYVQKLGLKTSIDWLYYARKSGKRPNNLPSRPDLIYTKNNKWNGWKDFLGRNLATIQEDLVQAIRCILYVIKTPNTPGNVYRINSTIEPIDKLKTLQSENKIRIVKIFALDSMTENWRSKINNHLKPYYSGTEHDYIIGNIWELLSDLSDHYSLAS